MVRKHLADEDLSNVLDLACGSGEVTLVVRELGGSAVGFDPYCHAAFEERTGQKCEQWSFEDICHGLVEPSPRSYSCIICCFALHLLDESYLPALCAVLSTWTTRLIVLTPHKRPHFTYGWRLIKEDVDNRVR